MLVRADGERQAAVVSSHQLLKEPFCRGNVTFVTQHKFDGVASGVDGAVEVFPLGAHLHVGLV